MSESQWNGNTGDWSDPSQWAGGVPGPGDYALFGAGSYIVTFDTIDSVAAIQGGGIGADFDVTGGLLQTSEWNWSGAFTLEAGTLAISGVNTVFAGPVALTGGELLLANKQFYATQFESGVTQTAGVIDIAAGPLNVEGNGSVLDGTITGFGALDIGGGFSAISVTLGSVVALEGPAFDIQNRGTLVLTASTYDEGGLDATSDGTLASNGQNFTVAGSGDFSGDFTGGGTLTFLGPENIGGFSASGLGSEILILGTAIADDNAITLGESSADQDALVVAAGGVLDLVSNTQITGNAQSTVAVLGTLALAAPVQIGPAVIDTTSFSLASTGLLSLAGALELEGGTASLTGAISGAGELEIGAYIETVSLGGIGLSVAALQIGNGYESGGELLLTANQDYGGTLVDGQGVIDTAGYVLDFTAGNALAFRHPSTGVLANTITGGGTVALDGQFALNGATVSGAELLITGQSDNQGHDLNLYAHASIAIAGGGVLNIEDGFGIEGSAGTSLNNAGIIEVTSPEEETVPAIDDVTFNNTGTILIGIDDLELGGGTVTLGGLVEGAGQLQLGGYPSYLYGETVTLNASTDIQTAGLDWDDANIILTANQSYAGLLAGADIGYGGNTIQTNGYSLTLYKGVFDGLVKGGGTIISAGALDIGGPPSQGSGYILAGLTGQGTTLEDANLMTDDGDLALGTANGDSTTLSVAANAVFDMTSYAAISSNGGVIENAGLFEASGLIVASSAPAVAAATFVNTGIVADDINNLNITSSFVNDGLVTVGHAMAIDGPVSGAGTFIIGNGASLSFDGANPNQSGPSGTVAASQTVSFATGYGELALSDGEGFAGTITGFTLGDEIQVRDLQINNFTYANGVLFLENTETASGAPVTQLLGTLALPGINPGEITLLYDQVSGGEDIELTNSITGSAVNPNTLPNGGTQLTGTWVGPSGGDWSNGANWDTQVSIAGALTNPSTQQIEPSGTSFVDLTASSTSYGVDYNTQDTVAGLTAGQGSTLNIAGGNLGISYQLSDEGVINITGGTLESIDAAAGGDVTAGLLTELTLGAAGVLQIDNGSVDIAPYGGQYNSTLAGTITGGGGLDITGGSTVGIAASAVLAIATLVNGTPKFLLQGNQSFSGNLFYEALGATLVTGGYDFTLAASAKDEIFGGISGGGTVVAAGTAYLDGGIVTGAGTELLIENTAYAEIGFSTGGNAPGAPSSSLVIASTGTLYAGDLNGEYGGDVLNNGLLDFIGVDGAENISANQFANAATGVLEIDTGSLTLFQNTNALAGEIAGNGELLLSAGQTTLESGLALNVATFGLTEDANLTLSQSLQYTGDFDDSLGRIYTNGYSLLIGGPEEDSTALLDGLITGGGTVEVEANAYLSGVELGGAGTELVDDGYMQVGPGGLELGQTNTDTVTFLIGGYGVFDVTAPSSTGDDGASTLVNAGLLEDTAGNTDNLFEDTFLSSGVIDSALNQVLEIDANTGTLGGVITGAGELALETQDVLTLAAGATLDIGTLGLSEGTLVLAGNATYAGDLQEFNPVLDLNGYGLDLAAGSTGVLAGELIGGGALTIGGVMFDQSSQWNAAGTSVDVTGTLYGLEEVSAGSETGAGVTLNVAGSGVLDFSQDGNFGASAFFSNFTLLNAGLIEKTGDTGTTDINAATFVNTGTIDAQVGGIHITGALVNDGVVAEDGFGAVQIAGNLTGTGVLIIDPAVMTLQNAVGAGQTVAFAGAGGTLVLTDSAQFAGTISGFGAGDLIDLTDISPAGITGSSFADGTLTIFDSNGMDFISFTSLAAGATPEILGTDGGSGTEIGEINALCTRAGTRITTPAGEIPVEELRIGDLVRTASGASAPIKWIGQRSYDARFIAGKHLMLPVCIKAGAITEGMPHTDLWVSPGHGLSVAGVLVPAWRLINGVTITQPAAADEVRYFHIELATHELILAEGCPAETFLDNGQRGQFHNATTSNCAPPVPGLPRTESGFALQAIQARLARRAGIAPRQSQRGPLRGYLEQAAPELITGWAQDVAVPDMPVCLDVLVGGRRIARLLANQYRADVRAAGLGSGCHGFELAMPAGMAGEVEVRHAVTGALLQAAEKQRKYAPF